MRRLWRKLNTITINLEFKQFNLTEKEGLKKVAGPYKKELIKDLVKNKQELSFYQSGDFIDLCSGPHVKSAREISPDSFKLTKLAGAYWRGSEKNKMLTRIYGVAFADKKALKDYLNRLEEAKKRDHRKLGKELGIFTMDDDVGPGLPLWMPNGTVIIEELEKPAKETEEAAGYKWVVTPHIAKESLYLTSGHLPDYKESMYPPMELEGV